MPGIVGLMTRMPREQAACQLRRMLSSLRHEAFYETGIWIDETLGIYVGWCEPNSVSAQMPMSNADESVLLLFSGEEFSETKGRDYGLGGRGSEYLIQSYANDRSFPAQLNGRFHGIAVDKVRGEIVLFNDRFGMHRLYYHESKDAFYFAVEAKAILSVCPSLKNLDPRGLGEFISCGCVLQNRTLFDGISVLPGAARWKLSDSGAVRKERYFDRSEWEQQTQLEGEAYYREIRDVFTQNLPKYFEAQAPIGMSLTGGLDTRMIMAWQKPAPGSLPCYTFGGKIRDCQDVVVARQVAHVCRQPHSIIRVGDDFLKGFPKYAERAVYLTDGCVDVSRSVDLYINQAARRIAPVRMTGNYGGEVMRRVRAFKPVRPLTGLYSNELGAYFQQAEATYAKLLESHPLSFAVFEQAPWHHYGLLALEQTQVILRTPYLDNDFVRTVFRAPESSCVSNDVCLRLIAEGDSKLAKIRTDRGLGEGGPRMTLLRALLQFQFKAEYAYDYGMPQWFAPIDGFLSPLRPERLFLGRHKFAHFRIWYRGALSSYIREVLLDSKSLCRPHIERTRVEALVKDHLAGRQNHTVELHKLLTIELIYRQLLDRTPDDRIESDWVLQVARAADRA